MADAAFVVRYRNGQVIAGTRWLSVSAHARHRYEYNHFLPVEKDGGARQTYGVGEGGESSEKSRVGGPLSNSRTNTAARLAGNEDLKCVRKKEVEFAAILQAEDESVESAPPTQQWMAVDVCSLDDAFSFTQRSFFVSTHLQHFSCIGDPQAFGPLKRPNCQSHPFAHRP